MEENETKHGCVEEDRHEYAEKICPDCGQDFCYSCCADQNVDQGGKYDPDFMLCPQCGHDYYSGDLMSY